MNKITLLKVQVVPLNGPTDFGVWHLALRRLVKGYGMGDALLFSVPEDRSAAYKARSDKITKVKAERQERKRDSDDDEDQGCTPRTHPCTSGLAWSRRRWKTNHLAKLSQSTLQRCSTPWVLRNPWMISSPELQNLSICVPSAKTQRKRLSTGRKSGTGLNRPLKIQVGYSQYYAALRYPCPLHENLFTCEQSYMDLICA